MCHQTYTNDVINTLFICVGVLIDVCTLIVIECCINGKIAELTNSLAFQSLFNYSQLFMAAFNLFITDCCILYDIIAIMLENLGHFLSKWFHFLNHWLDICFRSQRLK